MSTINKYVTNGITLSTGGSYTSPLTITASGGVYSYSGITIDGPSTQAWTVINNGSVISHLGLGIDLFGGGSVSNGGRISTKNDALDVTGGSGSITNTGTILSTNGYGIFATVSVTNSGTVSSQKGVSADGSVGNT